MSSQDFTLRWWTEFFLMWIGAVTYCRWAYRQVVGYWQARRQSTQPNALVNFVEDAIRRAEGTPDGTLFSETLTDGEDYFYSAQVHTDSHGRVDTIAVTKLHASLKGAA